MFSGCMAGAVPTKIITHTLPSTNTSIFEHAPTTDRGPSVIL